MSDGTQGTSAPEISQEEFDALTSDNAALLLQQHAANQILREHGLDPEKLFTEEKMQGLEFDEEGKVAGVYEYEVEQKQPVHKPARRQTRLETSGKSGMLTMESLKNMSPDEIRKDWANVSEFLRSQKRG